MTNFLLSITPWPVLSALLWIVLFVTALYFARPTAHKLILAMGAAAQKMFRTASLSVHTAEGRLTERNREVLLAAGKEAKWWHQFPDPAITMRQYTEPGQDAKDTIVVWPDAYKTGDMIRP